MDFPKPVEIDRLRLLPALAEMQRKALAQAEPHPRPRVVDRPCWLAHRAHDEIERFVDGPPAVDQGVVPVEQDCPGACGDQAAIREDWRCCHRAAAWER